MNCERPIKKLQLSGEDLSKMKGNDRINRDILSAIKENVYVAINELDIPERSFFYKSFVDLFKKNKIEYDLFRKELERTEKRVKVETS